MEKQTEKPKRWLADEHRKVAEEIIKKHITKRFLHKGCKRCNLTGIKEITDENTVRPCSMCVNLMPARLEWNEYCRQHGGLREWIIES